MLKRRTILGIVSCVAIMVLAWSGLVARGSATTVNDPQNDVGGGKIVADTGAEHYNVTCGNPPAASFIDIMSIAWTDDGVNYTITMNFWAPIHIATIIDGDIWGTMVFSVNGSTIDDYQLGLNFVGDVATWSIWNSGGNLANCASYTSSAIHFTFPKTFLSSTAGMLPEDQWEVRASVHYISLATSDMAWDVYNYPNYPETHGITCVTGTPAIPGYDLMLVVLVMVVSSMVAARTVVKRVRNSC